MKYRYRNTETIVESDHELDSANFSLLVETDLATGEVPQVKPKAERKPEKKTTARRGKQYVCDS